MSQTPLSVPTDKKDLCFIDLETTGPDFGFHEIIDIGAIRTCPAGAERLRTFDRRVVPRFPERATDFARAHTGFTPDKWPKEAPTQQFWDELKHVVDGATPVCHNPSFDRAFLSLFAAQYGVKLGLDYHWIGTESLGWPVAKLCKTWVADKFSQDTIRTFFGLSPEPKPHSAIRGAESCLQLYNRLMGLYTQSTLQYS